VVAKAILANVTATCTVTQRTELLFGAISMLTQRTGITDQNG